MPDTIAACSSGSMPCGIAVLRLSGPKALAITDGLFFPRTGGPLSTREPRKLIYGRLLARDGALLDLCLACRYSPKHSYTGEDLVEFFTHGSQAVAAGLLDTPRIFGAGKIITQIGGHGDSYQKLTLEASKQAYTPSYIVNGVDEMRWACRVNARNGADLIKIMTTGGVFSQGDRATPHSHFSQEEIRAAVEEADNMGSYVTTHAQANRGIKLALKNGVKCIEHGFYLDEECVELMVKNDCWLVPTLSIMHTSKLYFENRPGVLPYLKEKTLLSYEAHYRSLEMARKAGVKIGMGCDFLGDADFGCSYDKANMEFERMHAAGFTPLEIITMATKINSQLLLMDKELGTLETGKLADVILVQGDVSRDILKIRDKNNVKLVIQDGRIVKNIL